MTDFPPLVPILGTGGLSNVQSYGTRRVPTTFNVYLFLEFTIDVSLSHLILLIL